MMQKDEEIYRGDQVEVWDVEDTSHSYSRFIWYSKAMALPVVRRKRVVTVLAVREADALVEVPAGIEHSVIDEKYEKRWAVTGIVGRKAWAVEKACIIRRVAMGGPDLDGLRCHQCAGWYPYAQANTPEGTLWCYACRTASGSQPDPLIFQKVPDTERAPDPKEPGEYRVGDTVSVGVKALPDPSMGLGILEIDRNYKECFFCVSCKVHMMVFDSSESPTKVYNVVLEPPDDYQSWTFTDVSASKYDSEFGVCGNPTRAEMLNRRCWSADPIAIKGKPGWKK
jgi:hypothetical protein